jgi:endonuclease/exonuclease/phosphatase family metal-dependent hydrolase
MEDFRFATFNIHHGKDKATFYSNREMLESVASLEADILCVQELDTHSIRTHFVNQPEMIAKKLGYHYVSCRVRFFGFGFQHNAIFSKSPILLSEEISLPQSGSQQLRRALVADIEIDKQKLRVATVHLHTHHGKTKYNDWASNATQISFR